jgi:hypothetical protein
MGKIVTQCPSCNSSKLYVERIQCDQCHTTFEGKFDIHPLLKLQEDELNFILDFVQCSGSLKEMATKQGVSYPTLRNQLNHLIDNVIAMSQKEKQSKEDVLQMLEAGKISAKDAAKLLQKL